MTRPGPGSSNFSRVPPMDEAEFKKWMNGHVTEYGSEDWYQLALKTLEGGDLPSAWRVVAFASAHSLGQANKDIANRARDAAKNAAETSIRLAGMRDSAAFSVPKGTGPLRDWLDQRRSAFANEEWFKQADLAMEMGDFDVAWEISSREVRTSPTLGTFTPAVQGANNGTEDSERERAMSSIREDLQGRAETAPGANSRFLWKIVSPLVFATVLLAAVAALAIAYYFGISLPAYNRERLALERQRYADEQQQRTEDAKRAAERDEAQARRLQSCLGRAETLRIEYLELNGTTQKNGSIRTQDRFVHMADDRKKAEVDSCLRQFGSH